MHILFNDIHVQLTSPDAAIQAQWARLFAGWSPANGRSSHIILHLKLSNTLPPLPTQPPFFSDTQRTSGENGILDVYQLEGDHVLLHFLNGAQISLPLKPPSPTEPLTATGTILPAVFHDGRFLDITYTSLAPLFRRFGYFMIHAFAAAQNGRGILIVGPSGSGKTTTGLSLILAGWQLLCNDVLLIQNTPEGIIAHATPDDITIRPKTFTLLPELAQFVPEGKPLDQVVDLTGNDLTNGRWADPTPIETIYIPKIEERMGSEKRPLSRAICLAQLMEESVDKWDTQTLPDHLNALQTCVHQAQTYTLHLGTNIAELSDVIQQIDSEAVRNDAGD